MHGRWRDGRGFDPGKMTPRELLGAYATTPAIHLRLAAAALGGGLAVHRAEGASRPLLAAPATVLAYPVAWCLVHRFVPHLRFLYRSAWTAAPRKRVHFDRHQDPHRLDVPFGSPLNAVPTILAVALSLGWLVGGGPAGAAAAAACAGFLVTCVYGFCRCVQRLNVKPRSRPLRRAKEPHLAHHFHDEHGNHGVASFVVGRASGTCYAGARERRRSPHVFNLGHDLAEAARFPRVARLTGAPPRGRPPRPGERA